MAPIITKRGFERFIKALAPEQVELLRKLLGTVEDASTPNGKPPAVLRPQIGSTKSTKGSRGRRSSRRSSSQDSESYTIEEFAKKIGIGRNMAYKAAEEGQIPAIKVRGRWIIPHKLSEKFMNGQWQPSQSPSNDGGSNAVSKR